MSDETKAATRGRPPMGTSPALAIVPVRMNPEQKAAIEKHVARLNVERADEGLPPHGVSTWMRDLALAAASQES